MSDQTPEPLTPARPPSAPTRSIVRPPVKVAEGEPLVTITVAAGTQINHEGTVYRGGSTFKAPGSLARAWKAYGWSKA